MIHALESRGECRLLAVTLTKDNPCANPIRRSCEHFSADADGGSDRNGAEAAEASDTSARRSRRKTAAAALPATCWTQAKRKPISLLRSTLAAADDGSVVMVQVGFSTSLARLLDSKPDGVAALAGRGAGRQGVRLLADGGRSPTR